MSGLALDLETMITLVAVFVAGTTLILLVRVWAEARRDPIRQRLAAIGGGVAAVASRGRGSRLLGADEGFVRLLRPFERLKAGADEESIAKLRSHLIWAGYRKDNAFSAYLFSKLALAMIFGSAVLIYDQLRPITGANLFYGLVFCSAFGFYLPTIWLRGKIADRQKQLVHALPDSLDLLVSCVESGLSLESAIERVGKDIALSAPVLAQELYLTVQEINAGLSRSDCFRRLAARTGVPELKSLAAILVQTEMFGTSVGKALRIQAEALRVQRMQRANERAATVAVRLTIPLVLCLMPALMTVLMGGAVVRFVNFLIPVLRSKGG